MILMEAQQWVLKALDYLERGIPPELTSWDDRNEAVDLFLTVNAKDQRSLHPRQIPNKFYDFLNVVICHRDTSRFTLLYRVLWRITHDEDQLIHIDVDSDMQKMNRMSQAVRRDLHKLKAFVRFRKFQMRDEDVFVSWYEPDHYILKRSVPFFIRRFGAMTWMIVTPYQSVFWDGVNVQFGLGQKQKMKNQDEYDDLWKTYYAAIFNPARVKVKAMKNEMPVRFWKNLPEAELIKELLASAESRVQKMRKESR